MQSNMSRYLSQISEAKQISSKLALLSTKDKNLIMSNLAKIIQQKTDQIIAQNVLDINLAKLGNLPQNMIDRLTLNDKKIKVMVNSINDVIGLKDYVGLTEAESTNQNNGLKIKRVRIPIGLILMIYESRPNVTVDASILCIKSGNGVILKAGSDSINTSSFLCSLIKEAFVTSGFESLKNGVCFINSKDRSDLIDILQLDTLIDLVIPRGGKGLIVAVSNATKIPILKHLDGNCHTYLHQSAIFEKALEVVVNAKMRNTSVCGATESLLIDEIKAKEWLPKIYNKLHSIGCAMVGDDQSVAICPAILQATDEDFYTEFLTSKISIKIVQNHTEAINHINKYSSHHTDAIICEDEKVTSEFLHQIDSSIVMHNASTQFADGYELGMGSEIGISTGRLHARGPVALEGLTTYKYIVEGDYSKRP